jgi:hypothetical protein
MSAAPQSLQDHDPAWDALARRIDRKLDWVTHELNRLAQRRVLATLDHDPGRAKPDPTFPGTIE